VAGVGRPCQSGDACMDVVADLVPTSMEIRMTYHNSRAAGVAVVDNCNIQTAGPRGPALLQDVWLLEKLAHFHREVIPERRMTPRAPVPSAHSPSLPISGVLEWIKKRL
jgi:hypothetical protein